MAWMTRIVTPLAAATDAASQFERSFEFARFRQFDDERVLIALLVLVALLVTGFVGYVYRRDSVELRPSVGFLLMLLRLAAFAGLILFFLRPEMRTDERTVRDSRVVIVADVSQSMGIVDGSTADGATNAESRSEQVAAAMRDSSLINDLRQTNEVVVNRFDVGSERILAAPKLSGTTVDSDPNLAPAQNDPDSQATPESGSRNVIDWADELAPRGVETRVGEALGDAMLESRGSPLSAVVLISDGAQNAGAEPEAAVQTAIDLGVPVHTVGVGSPEVRRNVRVSDFAGPSRAYPGDAMTLSAYLQASGFAGRYVDVTLSRRRETEVDAAPAQVAVERVALGPDGELTAVPFEVTEEEVGRVTFDVSVAAPQDDANAGDNARRVDVDVVDRKLRALLVASGATREFRFLRNQLRRDKGFIVDVLIQSSPPGISQDADEILDAFPSTKDALYVYDCIVAFDVDWLQLDVAQVALLETWVSEEAGGLVLIAGPIHSSTWLNSAEHTKLAALFPVVFRRGLNLLGDGRYGSRTPWPLALTREGRQADFLQLGDSPEASGDIWSRFEGVYGYFAVKGPKPGATVFATFSDPNANLGVGEPVYMASQFFGAGRVFYLGSGEMWRLRGLGEGVFEVFYTKLLRYVTQGRLLRGDGRGVLLVERDHYLLGDTVVVQAQLKNERREPLTTPTVDLFVTSPQGTTSTVRMTRSESRPGEYTAQFRVDQEGGYELAIADSTGESAAATRRFQVNLPDLERNRSELNEVLLSQIASRTGGQYYRTLQAAVSGTDNQAALAERIPSREEIALVRGAPDRQFDKRMMTIILCGACGALCLEWLLRRVSRLA